MTKRAICVRLWIVASALALLAACGRDGESDRHKAATGEATVEEISAAELADQGPKSLAAVSGNPQTFGGNWFARSGAFVVGTDAATKQSKITGTSSGFVGIWGPSRLSSQRILARLQGHDAGIVAAYQRFVQDVPEEIERYFLVTLQLVGNKPKLQLKEASNRLCATAHSCKGDYKMSLLESVDLAQPQADVSVHTSKAGLVVKLSQDGGKTYETVMWERLRREDLLVDHPRPGSAYLDRKSGVRGAGTVVGFRVEGESSAAALADVLTPLYETTFSGTIASSHPRNPDQHASLDGIFVGPGSAFLPSNAVIGASAVQSAPDFGAYVPSAPSFVPAYVPAALQALRVGSATAGVNATIQGFCGLRGSVVATRTTIGRLLTRPIGRCKIPVVSTLALSVPATAYSPYFSACTNVSVANLKATVRTASYGCPHEEVGYPDAGLREPRDIAVQADPDFVEIRRGKMAGQGG